MSSITVKRVVTKAERKAFIRFPWKVYRSEDSYYPNWVPPLLMDEATMYNPKKNPFYNYGTQHDFLAYKGGEVVGRISAIVDPHFNEFQKKNAAFFGFYESFNDPEIAKALFEPVKAFAAERGLIEIMGPVQQHTNHILGTLVDAFDKAPVIQMGYNPPYYPSLFEAVGFSKSQDLLSYHYDAKVGLSDKMLRVTEMAKKRGGVTVDPIPMKEWNKYVDIIYEIWNDAWEKNWGFVPWDLEEFRDAAKNLKLGIIPELVFMARVKGEPAGFIIPLPELNPTFQKLDGKLLPFGVFKLLKDKANAKFIRIAVMGVKQKYWNQGVEAIMIKETFDAAVARGITEADFSWILETNDRLRNLLGKWGATHYKTHRVYTKEV